MWTDTHLHLDADEYASNCDEIITQARHAKVHAFVLPATHVSNFNRVQTLAHKTPGAVYTLGIHPLFAMQSQPQDLGILKQWVQTHRDDPKFAGIGEIGLDGFVDNLDWDKQWQLFIAQLRLACEFNCPVVLHVRKAQDAIAKGLRQYPVISGIAHAFNGSKQQAHVFIDRNLKLGFGGACTYPRALQLQRLASTLPWDSLVLETDGPDIPPAWVMTAGPGQKRLSEPSHVAQIAQTVATLRQCTLDTLSLHTQRNAQMALPALINAQN